MATNTEVKTRRSLSGLDNEDVILLQEMTAAAIKTGRKDDAVDDGRMARLYALAAKLNKIAEARTPVA